MNETPTLNSLVPPLEGKLPWQCQEDLEKLNRVVYGTPARENLAQAVPADQLREVLLTGVTGHLGRFFLHELLRQNEKLIVHCLVRAKNARHGFERIKTAMEQAEIWDDEIAPRVRVISGDICKRRFGLSEQQFDDLAEQIDGVYHLAASIDLVMSYEKISEINTLSLRTILELCLKIRYKHLFFISTMGVFPEYVCKFAQQYKQTRIEDQMPPDLSEMKKVFPVGTIGYPWSKLVAEQAVLSAKSIGVPVAIFRLPLIGPSSTGFMMPTGITTHLLGAAAQLKEMPHGFQARRNTEPVDIVSEICIAISLNTSRHFTIYHLCNPDPPYEETDIAEFGLHYRSVSYESFKRSCQALGDKSPMRGQWVLMDFFAPYWFNEKTNHGDQPVSDRAIREDCPYPIKWPALLARYMRTRQWLMRNKDKFPHPIPQGWLNLDGLIAQAHKYARQMDLPFDSTFPSWMLEGLEQLVKALQLPAAELKESQIGYVNYRLTNALKENAALARERHQHPEIEQMDITRPIFIIGINRTGTTLMHRLLARDPQFWALYRYELTHPTLPRGEYASIVDLATDPRRAYAKELLEGMNYAEELKGIHHLDVDEPEEDHPVLSRTFVTWIECVAHHIPTYGRWLKATGSQNAYAHHRRSMQHYTWQRLQRQPHRRYTWIFKMPFHLMEFEQLVQTYPDAIFIQTHREPTQFMPSWVSLVERIRSFTTKPLPLHEVGAEQMNLLSTMLNNAMQFRADHPELEHRWIDVRYADLVKNPIAVMNEIYTKLGQPFPSDVEDRMQKWLIDQDERRKKEPRHVYKLEDYGYSVKSVNETFAPYLEFISTRNLM